MRGSKIKFDGADPDEVGALNRLSQNDPSERDLTLAEKWAAREGVDLAQSYFYSDSYNDLPMLERVGTAIAVNPDARLLRHARKNGWQTTRWA